MASESRFGASCRWRSAPCFNEAEANWPRNLGRWSNTAEASRGFNEAEANWPRNQHGDHLVNRVLIPASMRPRPIGLGIAVRDGSHGVAFGASMRPRPIGLGIAVGRAAIGLAGPAASMRPRPIGLGIRSLSPHASPCFPRFNEAEANWPRNRPWGTCRMAFSGASMRPRPIGLGISTVSIREATSG